ncbi:MAG: FMN-binding protein [Mobilitalea sp.]
MKKKRTLLFVVFCIIVLIILVGATIKTYLEANLNKLANTEINDVDMTEVEDGVYNGSYNSFPVMVEVKVAVSNQKITEIELVKHVNGQGTPAEVITDKVIGAQSLQVDIISGATYSSKAILKAIENALSNEAK